MLRRHVGVLMLVGGGLIIVAQTQTAGHNAITDRVFTKSTNAIQAANVSPPRRENNRLTSHIRGHVTAEGGGPLRQVRVDAISLSPRLNQTGVTDDSGAYDITLPPGAYTVTVQVQGFLRATYGGGRRIVVKEDQTADGIDVILQRGGVIEGVVTDEFGTPVTGIQLTPLRSVYRQGQRQLVPSGSNTTTDDRGEFRLFGLTPGEYYVLATSHNQPAKTTDERLSSETRFGYPPTYYPGVFDVSQAVRVTVTAQNTAAADMTLKRSRLVTVSGIVLGSDGRVRNVGAVTVRPATGSTFGQSTSIHQDGSFQIRGLAPGSYFFTCTAKDPASIADGSPEVSAAFVTIGEDNMSGLLLEPIRMTKVVGRVVVNLAALPSLRAAAIRIGATSTEVLGNLGSQRPSTVNADLTFEFRTWPGRGVIRINSAVADRWVIKAVRLRGVDVTDLGIEFGNGQDVSGLEVELTDHNPEVTGMVATANGDVVTSYAVVVFAKNRSLWTAASGRYVALASPDQTGRFVVRSVPSGEYYAVAMSQVDRDDWTDPAVLDTFRSQAIEFLLHEGESKDLRLELKAR